MHTRTPWLIGLVACLLALGSTGAQVAPVERYLAEAEKRLAAKDYRHAANLYRVVLRQRPGHDRAYRRLWQIDKAIGVADDPAQRDRLAREIPNGQFLKQTDHYLIVYDGRHTWADSRARMLELAYDEFYRQFKQAGFRPLPVERRMVCVLFNKHETYLDYAKQTDRLMHEWSSGYYSQRTNRVAFFNIHYSPQLKGMVDKMRKLEAEVEHWQAEVAQNPRMQHRLNAARSKLSHQRAYYQRAAAFGNIQQTLHEAAHQIAFNSGIQRRGVQWPLWYSEGLATAFETIAPAAPFGPTADNAFRRTKMDEAVRAGRAIPLAEFIEMTAAPNEDALKREAAYAQSWGLFHYLFNQRREQLVAYTAAMNASPLGRAAPGVLRQRFVEAFGPIEQVERDYLTYISAMSR